MCRGQIKIFVHEWLSVGGPIRCLEKDLEETAEDYHPHAPLFGGAASIRRRSRLASRGVSPCRRISGLKDI
jgi:hypothetical protein